MALELDHRQRAMLQEMGIHVWLPGTDFAVQAPAADADTDAVSTAAPAARRAPPVAASAPEQPARAPATPSMAAAPPRPVVRSAPNAAASLEAAPDTRTMDWATLAHTAAQCRACGLCAGRKNSTLQAHPAPQADWMIVGEAPDALEDQAGQAFVGDSGVLLDNMLKAVGVQRGSSAYATNIVKCRPPHARIPQSTELAACAQSYLQREIALVQPRVIIAMGRFAHQALFATHPDLQGQPLGKLRGVVHHYQNTPVIATYHPANLLRTSADKAKAWADLCLAAQVVESPRA